MNDPMGNQGQQQQQIDPATNELLQRLSLEAQARNEETYRRQSPPNNNNGGQTTYQQPQPQIPTQPQPQPQQFQQPYYNQPMPQQQPGYYANNNGGFQAGYNQPPQQQQWQGPPPPRGRKSKNKANNRGYAAGQGQAWPPNYQQQQQYQQPYNMGAGYNMPPQQAQQQPAPQMPQIPPYYFVPEQPKTIKEKWEQIKFAFGSGSSNPYDNAAMARTQKPMKFLKGVSIGTNFGGTVFGMFMSVVAWYYGASASVEFLRAQKWGKFVDGDFWNVAIWFILLFATLFIIAATPLSWPESVGEWVSDGFWVLIFGFDVITNMSRINEWLPNFVLPGSNETIKWLWVIPVLVVVLSAGISYCPERLFWWQVQRLGQLRIQLAYQRLVSKYLKYLENVKQQAAYQQLIAGNGGGGNGQQWQGAAPNRYQ